LFIDSIEQHLTPTELLIEEHHLLSLNPTPLPQHQASSVLQPSSSPHCLTHLLRQVHALVFQAPSFKVFPIHECVGFLLYFSLNDEELTIFSTFFSPQLKFNIIN
jgi:hypothetical protein